MTLTPYTSNNQQQSQGYTSNPRTTQGNNGYAPASSVGYGASTPTSGGGYAPPPSTSTSTYSSSAYAPPPSSSSGGGYRSTVPTTTTTGGYQSSVPSTTGGYQTSGYQSTVPQVSGGGYQSSVPASTGYHSSVPSSGYQSSVPATTTGGYRSSVPTAPSPSSPLPDFSQALSHPPPQVQQQSAYQAPVLTTSRGKNDYGGSSNPPMAMATATGTAMSSINSSTYGNGPTHGLVSEGNPTICHKIDYEIKGSEMQLVEIELDPAETVIAEAGMMMYLEENIDFKAKFGDGSDPKAGFFGKLMSAGGRLLTGESLFITHFTNQGQDPKRVAFAAPYPGTILPINMANIGNKIICQKDAFLCAAHGTKLSVHFNKKIGSGLFGGEGFILEKLEGDGMAFIHAGGTCIKKELRGETLRLDTGCLVAFTDGINFDVQLVKGLKSMFFGGEGLFLATLQGHGTVWIQSLPFSRLADRIVQSAPSAGGRRQGEGSALTGRLGDVIDGDGFGFKF